VSASELALSFGRAAADYERGRPDWPDEGIDHAIDQLGLTADATVLDLAAGTGKLARKLVPRFHRVIAVEPDDAMRELLETIVPEADVLRGTAREIPLRAGEVDAVFIGEAFHWFARADALDYAKTRVTFGEPIANHQLIAGMLADMETKCAAARALLYRCAQVIDSGDHGPELTRLSAMTKLFCTDVAMEVTTDAVQVLGGYGYIQEYPVERMMRDAKITQIYEGTNQIQRLVIAREMLRD